MSRQRGPLEIPLAIADLASAPHDQRIRVLLRSTYIDDIVLRVAEGLTQISKCPDGASKSDLCHRKVP